MPPFLFGEKMRSLWVIPELLHGTRRGKRFFLTSTRVLDRMLKKKIVFRKGRDSAAGMMVLSLLIFWEKPKEMK